MRITFDSNTYRRVVDPKIFPKDPRNAEFVIVHDALRRGRIRGLLSETLATLEGISKAQRGPYFANLTPKVDIDADGGRISATIGPRHDLHPNLHPIVQQWINDAVSLGFTLMRGPRIGLPRPSLLTDALFEKDKDSSEMGQRQQRFFALGRAIDSRGAGFSVITALGERINARLGLSSALWYESLDKPKDVHEHNEIVRAVGEWADGDAVAAHYAYQNALFCTEDEGASAGGPSVLDSSNRGWLATTYSTQMVSLSDLAKLLVNS